MGTGIPQKIVSELDWDGNKDLDEYELKPLLEAIAAMDRFKDSSVENLMREVQSCSKKGDKVDVDALKKWFDKKGLDKGAQAGILEAIGKHKKKNPYEKGMKLDVLDNNKWRTAQVIGVDGYKIKITFEGWASDYDEWIHIFRGSKRLAEYGKETKGAWTGKTQVCPFYDFDPTKQDFKDAEEKLRKTESIPLKDLSDEDLKYVLCDEGRSLCHNMLRARTGGDGPDALIPYQVLKRYMRLLTRIFTSVNLDERKEPTFASQRTLDLVLQMLAVDERVHVYYYENPPSDIKEDDEKKYATKSKKANNIIVVNLINVFGGEGGFDEVKTRIRAVADNEKGTPLPYSFAALSRMIRVVSKLKPYLQKSFLDAYIPDLGLFDLVGKALGSLDDASIRTLDTKDVSHLREDIQSLISGTTKATKVAEFMEMTHLEVIKLLLKVDQLPKKMEALNDLGRIIKALEEKNKKKGGLFSVFSGKGQKGAEKGGPGGQGQPPPPEPVKLSRIDREFFLKWLDEEKVVSEVLRPDNHEMIIKLSVPILKYLAANRKLGPHLKTITNLLEGADPETAKVLSAAIADVAEKLPERELSRMFSTFTDDGKKPLKDYTKADLKLIADFTKSAIKANNGKSDEMYGVELIFWPMLQAENQGSLTPEVMAEARKSMRTLLATELMTDGMVSKLVERCVANWKKGKSVVNSLDLLKLLLEGKDGKQTNKKIKSANKQFSLTKIFFEDAKRYNTTAHMALENLEGGVAKVDKKTVLHMSPHYDQVSSRLSFLKFLIQNSDLALNNDEVDDLWTVCVTKSVTPTDTAQFMAWLSDCMTGKADALSRSPASAARQARTRGTRAAKGSDEKRVVHRAFDQQSTNEMFKKLAKKYKHSKTGEWIHVTPEWYQCFANTFTESNRKSGGLSEEGYVVDYKKLDDMGLIALWNFALTEPEPTVRMQAQKFVVGVHLKLDIKMKGADKIAVIHTFLDKCLTQLKEHKSSEGKTTPLVRDSVMTMVSQLVRRVEAGEMVKRPLFKVGEDVKASWKKPATTGGTLYKAKVVKVNDDEDEITYSLHYADGDKDPRAKESYIRTIDEKVKQRPPLVLSEAEKYPKRFLSGEVKDGAEFFDLAVGVLEAGGTAAQKTWNLMQMVPVHKEALAQVRKVPYAPAEDLAHLLPFSTERLLYILTILDPKTAYMESNPLGDPEWCMHFVKKGPLAHLVSILGKFELETVMRAPLKRLCLAKLLMAINYFLCSSEGTIRATTEEVMEQGQVEKVMDTCLKSLLLAANHDQGEATEAILLTVTIVTRLKPQLIPGVPKGAPWADVFSAALIANDNASVQKAFTKGVTDLCEMSTEIPKLGGRPVTDSKQGDDAKGASKEGDKGKDSDKDKDMKKAEKVDFHLDVHRFFIALDVDKNKLLDAKELKVLFHGGKPFPPGVADGVDQLIAEADMSKDGKISFKELSDYFQRKNLTSSDLEVTYRKLDEVKRDRDAKTHNAPKLRQDVRSKFLPILLARFSGLDTSKDCAQFLTLMGKLIRQSDTIEEKEAQDIATSLSQLIKQHPTRERTARDEDSVLGAFMRLTAETINKATFLRKSLGVGGPPELSLLAHVVECLFAMPEHKSTDEKKGMKPEAKSGEEMAPPKCKNPITRAAGFHLLMALVCDDDDNLREVLRLLTPNHLITHSSGKKPELWEYEPPSDAADRGAGYVGLMNCGNTCYINAALQQLFMMPKLRKELLKINGYDVGKKQLLYGFQWLLSHLQESSSRYIVPRPFLDSYIDPATGKPVRAPGSGSRQDDSLGFVQTLLGRIEDESKGTGYGKTIQNFLGIGECTEMIGHQDTPYLSDHKSSNRNVRSITISLTVKDCSTIQQCLANYVKGIQISGYKGASDPGIFGQSYEGQKISILKRTSFKSLPNTLVIGLNRMESGWDEARGCMVFKKLVHRVEFPFELDMKPYCIESLSTPKGYATGDPDEAPPATPAPDSKGGGGSVPMMPAQDTKTKKREGRHPKLGLPDRPDSYYKYRLMGVIVHSGRTLNSGHYYSFIRERPEGKVDPKPGQKGHRWYCFNDSSVTSFDPRKLDEETFGAVDGSWKSATAYVLFYARIDQEIGAEEEEKKSVPTEILERIWEENRVRVRDTNVFNLPYFGFLQDLLLYVTRRYTEPSEACKAVEPKDVKDTPVDLYDGASRLFLRFLFKTLARSARRPRHWQRFVDGAVDLLEDNAATSTWFISMLIHPKHKWLNELLLSPVEEVRNAAVTLFAVSAKTISAKEADAYKTEAAPEGDKLEGIGEVLTPSRGFVVQAVDRMLTLIDQKEVSSLVMESLANFASFGELEAGYLQKANVVKYMLSAITAPSSASHMLADAIFSMLCAVRKDLKPENVDLLLEEDFLKRLLIEPYNAKRAKPIVTLIAYICSPECVKAGLGEAADDAKVEAMIQKRLKIIVNAMYSGMIGSAYEQTRPYFRVLNGLVCLEGKFGRMAADMAIGAVVKSLDVIMPEFYRKTDFLCEHVLRLAATHANCAEALKQHPKALETITGFYTNYPEYKGALSKLDVVKVRKQEDPRYHLIITKANKQSKFAITHTLSSRYAPYGRSSAEKLKAFQSLMAEGGAHEAKDGYDSDDERHSRKIEDIKIGQRVDVLDTMRKWLLCEVVQIRGRSVEVHYVDYVKDWDEWLDISSPRLCLEPETLSRLQGIFDKKN